jgi:hypothetical protein
METLNMENTKERIKKQRGEEPEREIGAKGRRKAWNGGLMKYYFHKESAGSPNDIKRLNQLFNFKKMW